MPKRFTATEIWGEDWFLEMPLEYKLFWYYILSKCDHAGLWKPNQKVFEMVSGNSISIKNGLGFFNSGKERIFVTKKGNWWIKDFFVFQYGQTFNINNKLHLSIYSIYNQEDIDLRTNRGLKEVKWWSWSGQVEDFDTLKEKDKDSLYNSKFKTGENGKSKNFKAQGEELAAERFNRFKSELDIDGKIDSKE